LFINMYSPTRMISVVPARLYSPKAEKNYFVSKGLKIEKVRSCETNSLSVFSISRVFGIFEFQSTKRSDQILTEYSELLAERRALR
jgi:hypothetical protein